MRIEAWIVALSAVLSFGSRPEEIRFLPAQDLTLVKTFEVVSEMETESYSEHGSSSSSTSSERSLVVTDLVRSAEDGRILLLERTFDEVSTERESSAEFGDNSRESSSSGSSDVEGATVVFEWDADDEEYLAESDEVEREVLDELAFDLDFTALLPPDEEAAEGDEWTLSPDEYRTLMDPWKGLPWEWVNSDGETFSSSDEGHGASEPEIDESDDGELVVTFAGTRDEDGVTVAVLVLAGEMETERTVDATNEFEQGSSTTHSETTESRSFEGEALWDLEGGHLLSLRLEVELSASGTRETAVVFGDQEFEDEAENERDGTIVLTVWFEREDP